MMKVSTLSCPSCKHLLTGFTYAQDGSLRTDKSDIHIEHDENGDFIECPNCGHHIRSLANKSLSSAPPDVH